MKPALRPATLADAPRVADLLIDTRRAFMPFAPMAHPAAAVRAWVASALLPAGGVTVAVVQGRVMAAVATRVTEGGAWIDQMAVDPAWVGQGLGTRLLRHVLEVLPGPVRLHTFQANTGARRFYERHGFVPIAFTDGHDNEERCPDVLYERPR